MLNTLKHIFKATISVYLVIILLSISLVLSIYFNYKLYYEKKREESIFSGKTASYWIGGNIQSEGYLKEGRKVGFWYYYDNNGYLNFIDDVDGINKGYVVNSRYYNGYPKIVSYMLANSDKDISAFEEYGRNGRLNYLYINIPSKKIYIIISYDILRHIRNVKYDI